MGHVYYPKGTAGPLTWPPCQAACLNKHNSQSADVAARDATTLSEFNLSSQAEAAYGFVGSGRRLALELHTNRDTDDVQDAPVSVPAIVGHLVAGRPRLAAADSPALWECGL